MTFPFGGLLIGHAIVRILAGTGTAADEVELQRWLAGSPDRVREFEELRAIWAQSGTSQPDWNTASLQRRILQATSAGPNGDATVVSLHPAGAGRRNALRLQRARDGLRAWLPAAAVLLLTVGAGAWWALGRPRPVATTARRAMVELTARPGHRATFRLPDGSWVVLGTGSRLRYAPPLATSRNRDVYLDGEAYFEVAHDLARPFRVHAGSALTRVLGTRFGVRAYAGENTVRVVVAEGRVGFSGGTTDVTVLEPGELGALELGNVGDTVIVRRGVDVIRYLAWAREAVMADARNGDVVLGVWLQDTLAREQRMKLEKQSVKRFALPALLAGAALGHPVPAGAQTAVTPADLVGTWMKVELWNERLSPDTARVLESIWTFRADSTWTARGRKNGVDDEAAWYLRSGLLPTERAYARAGRWDLRSDTLRIFDPAGDSLLTFHRIARIGDELIRTGGGLAYGSTCVDTLRRVDDSKPLPPAPTPKVTVDPAAMVGTWAASDTAPSGSRTDFILTLRADGTAEQTTKWKTIIDANGRSFARPDSSSETGEWQLYPPDVLGVRFRPGRSRAIAIGPVQQQPKNELQRPLGYRILQQGHRLVYKTWCVSNQDRVYTRISP